jgi:hypothetical protein
MIILVFSLLGWWLFSFKAAITYFAIVVAGTLLMSWSSAFSSHGIVPNTASQEERWGAFRMLLFGLAFGIPWWPIDIVGIVAALAVHYLTK